MSKNKENARRDYMEMIEKSWTWARLTSKERERFVGVVNTAESCGAIFGSYNQRWEILCALYHSFLEGCNYDLLHWREPENAEPVPEF